MQESRGRKRRKDNDLKNNSQKLKKQLFHHHSYRYALHTHPEKIKKKTYIYPRQVKREP